MGVAIQLFHTNVLRRPAFLYNVPTEELLDFRVPVEQWSYPTAHKQITLIPFPGHNRVDYAAEVKKIGLGSQAIITDRSHIGVHWEQSSLAEVNQFEG